MEGASERSMCVPQFVQGESRCASTRCASSCAKVRQLQSPASDCAASNPCTHNHDGAHLEASRQQHQQPNGADPPDLRHRTVYEEMCPHGGHVVRAHAKARPGSACPCLTW